MSDSKETQMSSKGTKKKTWCIVGLVILFILALPVLVPLSLGAAGVVLAIGLAAAGGILTVLLCVLGGLAMGILLLVALLFCGVVGTGAGIVLLFSAPASGMAIFGMSLMAVGAGILGTLLVWGIFVLVMKGCRAVAHRAGKTAKEVDHEA